VSLLPIVLNNYYSPFNPNSSFFDICSRTYWGGNIVGVGAIPLPPGPLVIWVDEKEPEFWPDILERQKKPKEGLEVHLHHFRSTGEVLAWMGRNQESLRGKSAKKSLRIASSSKRDEADGEYAGNWREVNPFPLRLNSHFFPLFSSKGKKLYKLIRKEEHYKAIPFLVYCTKTEMAGFQENETDADPYLRLTSEPYEMVSFGCLRPLLWLKDSHSEWQEVKGPGIYLRLIEVVAFDPALLKGKEWYSAIVSKSDIPTKKLKKNPSLVSFQTEMKEGGKWVS
jgi:hypothetical protein